MKKIFNTTLHCIKSGSSMTEAGALMVEKRIRHLPVIDDENQIIGMLSKHDLTDVEKFQDLPIDFFASFPAVTVSINENLSSVALKMVEEKISSVIVCNEKNQALGIITTSDLLFQFAQLLKEKEKEPVFKWNKFTALTTAGELFRELANAGI